jgi:hypothetical protein
MVADSRTWNDLQKHVESIEVGVHAIVKESWPANAHAHDWAGGPPVP